MQQVEEFWEAVEEGDVNTVECCLEQGVPVDAHREGTRDTALSVACERGHSGVVACLLTHGACPELRGATGRAVTHSAASRDAVGALRELFQHGADLNMADMYGATALHLAVANRCLGATRFLLESGANVNRAEKGFQRTALHHAVAQGDFRSAQLLLEHGATVNCQDVNGLTPLHEAISDNDYHMCRLLLKHGARTDISEAIGGLTALHLECSAEVSRLLWVLGQRAAVARRDSDRSVDSGASSMHTSQDNLTPSPSPHASRDNTPQGRDHSPTSRDNIPQGSDHSPTSRDNMPQGRDDSPTSRDNMPQGRDHSPISRDNIPQGSDHSPPPSRERSLSSGRDSSNDSVLCTPTSKRRADEIERERLLMERIKARRQNRTTVVDFKEKRASSLERGLNSLDSQQNQQRLTFRPRKRCFSNLKISSERARSLESLQNVLEKSIRGRKFCWSSSQSKRAELYSSELICKAHMAETLDLYNPHYLVPQIDPLNVYVVGKDETMSPVKSSNNGRGSNASAPSTRHSSTSGNQETLSNAMFGVAESPKSGVEQAGRSGAVVLSDTSEDDESLSQYEEELSTKRKRTTVIYSSIDNLHVDEDTGQLLSPRRVSPRSQKSIIEKKVDRLNRRRENTAKQAKSTEDSVEGSTGAVQRKRSSYLSQSSNTSSAPPSARSSVADGYGDFEASNSVFESSNGRDTIHSSEAATNQANNQEGTTRSRANVASERPVSSKNEHDSDEQAKGEQRPQTTQVANPHKSILRKIESHRKPIPVQSQPYTLAGVHGPKPKEQKSSASVESNCTSEKVNESTAGDEGYFRGAEQPAMEMSGDQTENHSYIKHYFHYMNAQNADFPPITHESRLQSESCPSLVQIKPSDGKLQSAGRTTSDDQLQHSDDVYRSGKVKPSKSLSTTEIDQGPRLSAHPKRGSMTPVGVVVRREFQLERQDSETDYEPGNQYTTDRHTHLDEANEPPENYDRSVTQDSPLSPRSTQRGDMARTQGDVYTYNAQAPLATTHPAHLNRPLNQDYTHIYTYDATAPLSRSPKTKPARKKMPSAQEKSTSTEKLTELKDLTNASDTEMAMSTDIAKALDWQPESDGNLSCPEPEWDGSDLQGTSDIPMETLLKSKRSAKSRASTSVHQEAYQELIREDKEPLQNVEITRLEEEPIHMTMIDSATQPINYGTVTEGEPKPPHRSFWSRFCGCCYNFGMY